MSENLGTHVEGQGHTPGPWKVAVSVERDFVGVFPDTGEQAFPICKMPDFIRREVNEANAQMIAATPELLAAADAVLASRSDTFKARNGREMGVEDDSGEKMWIVPFDEMLALEAAVAKARGRS